MFTSFIGFFVSIVQLDKQKKQDPFILVFNLKIEDLTDKDKGVVTRLNGIKLVVALMSLILVLR